MVGHSRVLLHCLKGCTHPPQRLTQVLPVFVAQGIINIRKMKCEIKNSSTSMHHCNLHSAAWNAMLMCVQYLQYHKLDV